MIHASGEDEIFEVDEMVTGVIRAPSDRLITDPRCTVVLLAATAADASRQLADRGTSPTKACETVVVCCFDATSDVQLLHSGAKLVQWEGSPTDLVGMKRHGAQHATGDVIRFELTAGAPVSDPLDLSARLTRAGVASLSRP